jgi:hypothetical protein
MRIGLDGATSSLDSAARWRGRYHFEGGGAYVR